MPGTYAYPGVYVEEIPSGVRTITGVSTSDTAFVDFFKRGPLNDPVRITSYSDFERRFGSLDADSKASYAIQQFYLNGGQVAWVVRIAENAKSAVLELKGGSPIETALTLEAASPGLWGTNVEVAVGSVKGKSNLFNLVVREVATQGDRKLVVNNEVHLNLSMDQTSARYVEAVLKEDSSLVRVSSVGDGDIPIPCSVDVTSATVIAETDPAKTVFQALNSEASDGTTPTDSTSWISGIKTLDKIAPFIFNILCLPGITDLAAASTIYSEAEAYCEGKRAFLIVDIPSTINTNEEMQKWMNDTGDSLRHKNAAVYYPWFEIADRLKEDRPLAVAPSGTLAGIYARTDAARGIWKAPAGTEAVLRGATLKIRLTDLENGGFNQIGVNILRNFPIYGNICWGSRTLDGADQQASEWKYIPVRRTALYIEESLFQGLKWVVFEPNDEPLWAQIRLNVGAFMHNLFRQGAFQGTTPRDAYFVKCDKETTTQNDIDRGIVNILVGFAPLKPAEFVVIKIQQIAGQIEV
jgi:phage tail sheath protein FI